MASEFVEISTTLRKKNDLLSILEASDTSDVLFGNMSIGELYHLSNVSKVVEEQVLSHIKRRRKFNPDSQYDLNQYMLHNGNYR